MCSERGEGIPGQGVVHVSWAYLDACLRWRCSDSKAGVSIYPTLYRQQGEGRVNARLDLVKSINTREDLALEELEGSTAAGGDVAHLVGKAELLNSRDGIATANDGAGAGFGDVSKGLSNALGASTERIELEHAHLQ